MRLRCLQHVLVEARLQRLVLPVADRGARPDLLVLRPAVLGELRA